MVDGLEHGRAVAILKLHHVLTNGVGGISMLLLIVDLEHEPGDPGPRPPLPDPRR